MTSVTLRASRRSCRLARRAAGQAWSARPSSDVGRRGIRASVESYSIKKIEKFYLPEREGGITDAGFSVVEYERWMETGDPTILDAIAAYNRDDCVSTWGLRDWLEARRIEAAPLYPDGVVPRPEIVDPEPLGGAGRGPGRDPGPRRRAPRRRPGGPRRAGRRAAGSLAARGTPRLASPRGQAPVVGLLPAARRLDRRPRRGRLRARRAGVRRGPRPDQELTPPPLPVRPVAGDEAPRRRQPARPGDRPGRRRDRRRSIRCAGCSS